MVRFLTDQDYDVQVRGEIKQLLQGDSPTKVARAEAMAIAQMRNYLSGRYDVNQIFQGTQTGATDTRNAYIVMLAIDIAMYHLWASEAPNRVSNLRETRYQDALNWLRDAGNGTIVADLPPLLNAEQEYQSDIRLFSKPSTNHKW